MEQANNAVYLNADTIIQPQAYSFLKEFASKLPPQDRLVTITFSEYKLLDVVPIDYKYDDQPPPNFIVVGVHFIKADKYQPIGTLFLYDESYAKGKTPSSKELADCLRLYILAVAKIPLTVVSTVAPPSGTFKKALGHLIGVRDMASFDGPLVYSVFHVKNIIHLYDPPSLLRAFRNFFMHQDIEFKISETVFVASWKDISDLFAQDKLPFLIKEHVAPALTIGHTNYAVSIFSNKVRNAISNAVKSDILPSRAIGTSVLIKIFNDLFDSFNSCHHEENVHTRHLISKESFHHSFWESTLKILASIFFLDKTYTFSNLQGCVEENIKYSDIQKAISDDPMGDINIKIERTFESDSRNESNASIIPNSINVKSENHSQANSDLSQENISTLSSNSNNCVDNINGEKCYHKIKNVNAKVHDSVSDGKKQIKLSTLRMNFLDGLKNNSVVEFKKGKDISKKGMSFLKNSRSNVENCALPTTNHSANTDQTNKIVNSQSNGKVPRVENTEAPRASNKCAYLNGEGSEIETRNEEDEANLKKFIAEFSKCNVKDCYGFFEDKECDVEMEYLPLLDKGKHTKNKRNKKKYYDAVQRISTADSEESEPDADLGAIKLAVDELKKIEDIVKNSGNNISKKRNTKNNRKKLKSHKISQSSENLNYVVNNNNDKNAIILEGKGNKNVCRNNKNIHLSYPLNNTLQKDNTLNQCIKKLDVFTENNTNSSKIVREKANLEKTGIEKNNLKSDCDTNNTVNHLTNNIMKSKVGKFVRFEGAFTCPSDSEQNETLTSLLGMDVDEYNSGYSGLKPETHQLNYYKISDSGRGNNTTKEKLINHTTPDILKNHTPQIVESYADYKMNAGMKEMLDLPGFESDSEPDMPTIPISDILEKLDASDKQPTKVKYIKHEITSNWMSNVQGMQLIVKRLRKEGLRKFSSRVFNVDCTNSYVSHVRDANHRLTPNMAYFNKSIAKLLDPFHAVLAMSKGTAVLLP